MLRCGIGREERRPCDPRLQFLNRGWNSCKRRRAREVGERGQRLGRPRTLLCREIEPRAVLDLGRAAEFSRTAAWIGQERPDSSLAGWMRQRAALGSAAPRQGRAREVVGPRHYAESPVLQAAGVGAGGSGWRQHESVMQAD